VLFAIEKAKGWFLKLPNLFKGCLQLAGLTDKQPAVLLSDLRPFHCVHQDFSEGELRTPKLSNSSRDTSCEERWITAYTESLHPLKMLWQSKDVVSFIR
jgi:hypothetical protein